MSMTGFGRGFVERDGRRMLLELKSVNHRFLDISMRLPKSLGALEDPLRRRLQERFGRGHIDVYLKYDNEAAGSRDVHVDRVVNRWGYVAAKTPEKTMLALMETLPEKYWIELNRLLVPFGKHVCTAERPKCSGCPLLSKCRQVGVADPR